MAITPGGRVGDASPLGKPGGKRRLSNYTREIAHALIRAGHPKGEAIAIARNAEKRFAVKSKNPAIRAAALKATAEDRALSHQSRDLSVPAFADIPVGGVSLIDLDWAAFDANRPAGQQQQPDLLTAQTHTNIAAFQKAHGLPVTGQIDAATVKWLNDPKNSTAAQSAAKAASTKAAAAAKKTAAQKTAAAKKAAAALAKEQKAAATAASKQTAANAKAAAAAQKQAAAAGKANAGSGSAVRAVSLAVPVVGINDGGRMAGKPAFGGKKAAPFKKGGGRVSVKSEAVKREAAKRGVKTDMSTPAPGTIKSGAGKGKFPVTNQHQVKSALFLAKHGKGVSAKTVVAHVKAEAKKRGLKIPKNAPNVNLSVVGGTNIDLDWAAWDAAHGGGSKRDSIKKIGEAEHGSDMSKWKAGSLKTYAQMGHQGARDELNRRAAVRAKAKSKMPPKVKSHGAHSLPTKNSIKAYNEQQQTAYNSATHSLGPSRRRA